jgi:hypothetical protein
VSIFVHWGSLSTTLPRKIKMRSLRLFLLSSVVLFVANSSARSQVTAPNGIYVELLGNAGVYSINYDRYVADNLSIRAGFEYIGVSGGAGTESSSVSLLMIPITCNLLIASNNKGHIGSSKFELGLGVEVASFSASISSGTFGGFGASGLGILYTGTIGYRYQPSDGGFIFRIGFTPLFSTHDFVPFGGLSLGIGF